MEGLNSLKGYYMCKLDLKDFYFSVLLHQNSQRLDLFVCEWELYEFPCLSFCLDPVPKIFTK